MAGHVEAGGLDSRRAGVIAPSALPEPPRRLELSRDHPPITSQPPPTSPVSFLAELWQFLRVRKKFWLAPVIVILLIVCGLLVLVQGSALAPFIYSLF